MEAVQAPPSGLLSRGGYRGRGAGGIPMRGGFERGRGRGMGRGHYISRGGLGLPPMMARGGGMRPPRGMGYQGRGAYIPRGAGGPPMRGGRPPLYAQPPKQHSGSENNKTVSPVPTSNNTAETTNGTTAPANPTSVTNESSHPPLRGTSRGRGGPLLRGGRGGYLSHSSGGYNGTDHNGMPLRRGGPPRGRGGYGQSILRPPMTHSANNTQIAPVPTLKRGAPGGPPGPKRGRYDHGPYSTRAVAPKYHQQVQSVQQSSTVYATSQPQNHHSYQSHDQSQVMDPYAYSPTAAPAYNGYVQASYGTAPSQTASGYSHGGEYDQSQYQNYSSGYGTSQDTRYQSYGQDYTQTYGAPAVDYSAPPPDYSQQQGQGYDERIYTGYDSQSYQQNYSNTTGYY